MEYRYTDDNESDGMSQASSHQPSVHTNVHLRVSSRHLALASTIFCGMLDSGCKEASMLQMNGSVVIPLPEDDPDALIILLDIIHGKTRRVPHYLGFGQLIKLASLIDYYQILEAVDMWFDVWLFDFDFEIGDSCQEPGKYVHGIAMKHLWLSWVFRKSNEFSTITRALQHLGEVDAEWEEVYGVDSELEQEEADKLPIPQTILGRYMKPPLLNSLLWARNDTRIDAIQSRRDKAKSDAIGVIHNLISQYSGPGFMCTNRHYCEAKKTACDATVLGSLIRGASQLQILPARKEYEGSFSRLIKEIKGIKIFTTCNLIEGYANDNDIHRIQASIDVKLTEISNNLIGLQLIDFISSHSSSVSI